MPELLPPEPKALPLTPSPELAKPVITESSGAIPDLNSTIPAEPEAGAIHADIADIPVVQQPQEAHTLLTIVAPTVEPEQTEAFRSEMKSQRSIATIIRKVFHIGTRPGATQNDTGLDAAIGYAEKTNYPDTFPYEACYAGPKYWALVMNLFEKHGVIKPGARVLEIGSATGNLLEEINTAKPDAKLTGVDISTSAAQKAKVRVPDATIAVGDLNEPGTIDRILQLPHGDTDVFIALDVIEHMKTPELQDALMQKMYEHLSPGGYALIGMPELPGKNDGAFKRWFKTLWNRSDVDTTHYNKPTPERFDSMIHNDRVHFEKLADFGYFPIPAPIGGLLRLGFSANRMMLLRKPVAA